MYRTIQAAAEALRQGRTTPHELLDQCFKQIDKYEEKVKAWVFVDRDSARQQAEKLSAELKTGHNRGPLHGIPIAIKDIIDVHDWPTAAGSKLWSNSIARDDAPVVKKLRRAGAVLMGKTVTTQYASFDPPVTRNPWNLQRTPGGSSSGSAAAVACGMCLGALGTQTGGSITRPAAYCGVASCKPSYGRVSVKGVVPLAPSMDHVGPIARCVWDVAAILQVLASDDWEDPTAVRTMNSYRDLLAPLNQTALSACLSLARPSSIFQEMADDSVREFMDGVTEKLREEGASVEVTTLPPEFSDVLTAHRTVMAVEAAAFHEARFKRHPEDYSPNISQLVREGLTCPALEYEQSKQLQEQFRFEARYWFCDCEALLLPATTSPAPDWATTGDPAFNSPWSFTGLPVVSVPAGRSADGLPLSIQLVGRRFEESDLLRAASWCEKMLAQPLEDPPA